MEAMGRRAEGIVAMWASASWRFECGSARLPDARSGLARDVDGQEARKGEKARKARKAPNHRAHGFVPTVLRLDSPLGRLQPEVCDSSRVILARACTPPAGHGYRLLLCRRPSSLVSRLLQPMFLSAVRPAINRSPASPRR